MAGNTEETVSRVQAEAANTQVIQENNKLVKMHG